MSGKEKIITAKEYEQQQKIKLCEVIKPEGRLQEIIVQYVGDKLLPENNEVTIDMIVQLLGKEFPDLVLALAEENWVRGYSQACADIKEGRKEERDGELHSEVIDDGSKKE